MRALLLTALLLAVPVAAGASFFLLPATNVAAQPCGADACIALLPGEESVLVHAGLRYTFLDATGASLDAGPLCGARYLQVPPGAIMLVVTPGDC